MKGLLTYGCRSMDPYTQIGYLLAMVNNDVNNVGTYYLGIGTYRLAIGSYYLGIGTHRLAIGTYCLGEGLFKATSCTTAARLCGLDHVNPFVACRAKIPR